MNAIWVLCAGSVSVAVLHDVGTRTADGRDTVVALERPMEPVCNEDRQFVTIAHMIDATNVRLKLSDNAFCNT